MKAVIVAESRAVKAAVVAQSRAVKAAVVAQSQAVKTVVMTPSRTMGAAVVAQCRGAAVVAQSRVVGAAVVAQSSPVASRPANKGDDKRANSDSLTTGCIDTSDNKQALTTENQADMADGYVERLVPQQKAALNRQNAGFVMPTVHTS